MPEYEEQIVSVIVHSNAEPSNLRIRLVLQSKKDAVPRIYIDSPRVEVHTKQPGETVADDYQIQTLEFSDDEQWLKGLSSADPALVVASGLPVISDEKKGERMVIRTYRFPLKCTGPPSDSRIAWLTPLFSWMPDNRVRVQCIVECSPSIRAVPGMVRLGNAEVTLVLIGADDTPFSAISASIEQNSLGNVRCDATNAASSHTRKVTPSRSTEQRVNANAELRIATSLPDGPLVRVPIRIIEKTSDSPSP